MNFYISDIHFGHQNVINFDNRPFKTISEMDETIIKNWNSIVTPEDQVYIIGDFSWRTELKTIDLLQSLSGHKTLIKGNHDRISHRIGKLYDYICDYKEITDKNERIIMCHYPLLFWNGQFRDTVHLYGHLHNTRQWDCCKRFQKNLQSEGLPTRMFNVGCMMEYMNYTPQPLDEILNLTKVNKNKE